MRRSSRWARLLSVGVVAAVTLTACGGDGEGGGGASADDGELTPITVASLPLTGFATLFLGIDQGFFEEEGLEVETQLVQSGSDAITGGLGGTFDFFAVGYVPGFTAVGQNLPVQFVSGNDNGGQTEEEDWLGVMVGADSDIQGPEDLAGKTVAVNALKGVLEITLSAALEKQGLDPSTVNYTEIPFPEMPAALAGGNVDAIFATEPFLTPSLDTGGRIVFSPYTTLSPAFPNAAWGTTRQKIETDPETVDAFVRAITKSIEFAADNPDAVREIVPTYTQVPAEVAAAMRLPTYDAELHLDLLHDLLDYTQQYGTLEEIPEDSQLFYQP